jgi:hypothetical protein
VNALDIAGPGAAGISGVGMVRQLGAFIALAACFTMAAAEVLGPGGLVEGPPGTTGAAEPGLQGKVVEDVVTRFSFPGWLTDASTTPPATFNGDVSGTVRTRVVLAGDGTYDFYWQVTVDRRSFLPIARLELGGLAPRTYNANWRSDSQGTVSPAYVAEQVTGEVTWAFGQYVPPSALIYPGQASYQLFLDSDATAYGRASLTLVSEEDGGGNMLVQWGGASGALATFGPADGSGASGSRHSPTSIAARYVKDDPFFRAFSPGVRGCIVSQIAQQQAKFGAYGPRHGPFDEPAIRAAARSFASGCR